LTNCVLGEAVDVLRLVKGAAITTEVALAEISDEEEDHVRRSMIRVKRGVAREA
jgi:hypothetical protein